MNYKKTLLIGLNASFSHTALSLYSIARIEMDTELKLIEATINEPVQKIFRKLVEEEADLYCFSTYIWNIDLALELARMIKAISDAEIIFGGPEAGYNPEGFLEKHPEIDGVLTGEGELSFPYLFKNEKKDVPGLYYREGDNILRSFPGVADMAVLPLVYKDFKFLPNKMYYYEASRGCPYKCSFCLSQSSELREVPMEDVKKEILYMIKGGVKQVKFVDRTMNANTRRFLELIDFIEGNDNGYTNFHMEIHPAAMAEEAIERIGKLRKDLLQFEIGVQSTYEKTCQAIHRVGDTEKIREVVARLKAFDNAHLHLDLIAGLPYESLVEFRQSYNDVIAMNPDKLQLGFLKLLHGTKLRNEADRYGIRFAPDAPYEVIKTDVLSAKDMFLLKDIEFLNNNLYNEPRFLKTIEFFFNYFETPWDFLEEMVYWGRERNIFEYAVGRDSWYELLYEFGIYSGVDEQYLLNILLYDALFAWERPNFFKEKLNIWKIAEFRKEYVQNVLVNAGYKPDNMYRQTFKQKFDFDIKNNSRKKEDIEYIFVKNKETNVLRIGD